MAQYSRKTCVASKCSKTDNVTSADYALRTAGMFEVLVDVLMSIDDVPTIKWGKSKNVGCLMFANSSIDSIPIYTERIMLYDLSQMEWTCE